MTEILISAAEMIIKKPATIISKRETVMSAPDAVMSGPHIIIHRRDAIMSALETVIGAAETSISRAEIAISAFATSFLAAEIRISAMLPCNPSEDRGEGPSRLQNGSFVSSVLQVWFSSAFSKVGKQLQFPTFCPKKTGLRKAGSLHAARQETYDGSDVDSAIERIGYERTV